MKKILVIILCLLYIPIVKAYAQIDESEIPVRTYVIGSYMFTRNINEEVGYDGVLTTKRIMLGAKTIEGNDLDDMIIYYKKANGGWIDALSGENVETPEIFKIEDVDLVTWEEFSTRTITETKVVNGKTLNLEYRLSIGDIVTGSLYINNNLVIEDGFNINECGTGACDLEEDIAALLDFKFSDIESGIINGDEEYLYFISKIIWGDKIYVINDTGNVIFEKFTEGWNMITYDCVDKEYFEDYNNLFLIERGTPDVLYYTATTNDEWHKSKIKVTFANSLATETKILTCTANPDQYEDIDLDWYEETKFSKTLNVDGQMKTFTIGYYPTYSSPKSNEITFDLIYEGVVLYTTRYIGTSEDEFNRNNMLEIANAYKLDTIGGVPNTDYEGTIDYIYLTELKETGMTGSATYITIFSRLDESYDEINDYYDVHTFGPLASIKVSEAGQGITPLETHPRYNQYLTTGSLSYYILNDEIYYLVQAPNSTDKAVEYKVTIGKNGQIVTTNLGTFDVAIEGAVQ